MSESQNEEIPETRDLAYYITECDIVADNSNLLWGCLEKPHEIMEGDQSLKSIFSENQNPWEYHEKTKNIFPIVIQETISNVDINHYKKMHKLLFKIYYFLIRHILFLLKQNNDVKFDLKEKLVKIYKISMDNFQSIVKRLEEDKTEIIENYPEFCN